MERRRLPLIKTSRHEGACFRNTLRQQIFSWSLLPHIRLPWFNGAKPESNTFFAQQLFSNKIVVSATVVFAWNRWCRRGSFSPKACFGSVLQGQAPSCVSTFKLYAIHTRIKRQFAHMHRNLGKHSFTKRMFSLFQIYMLISFYRI